MRQVSVSHHGRSSIRRSTDSDIRTIHSWLVEEEASGVHGNFLCNWRLTEECHEEGRLLVFVDGASRTPVAYQWGGLVRPGILQVRQDVRGKGIGRKLVARCIADAYKHNECLLFIDCKPSTSIPFWRAMGFTLLDSPDGKNYAYRVLEKKHALPTSGRPVHAVIRFYPEYRKWDETARPCTTATPVAACASDGTVRLCERVFFFEDLYPGVGDAVVEIAIDGQVRYCDKAKYEESEGIGVLRCTNGFYIDVLRLFQTGNEDDA